MSLVTVTPLSGQPSRLLVASRIVSLLVLTVTGQLAPGCIPAYLDKTAIIVVGSKVVVSAASWTAGAAPSLDCPYPMSG